MKQKTIFAYILLFESIFSLFTCIGIAEASHTKATTTSSGKYDIAIPILFGVTRADITPDFGDPRGGGTRKHEGQDIMAPEGTPIVSPVKGTVAGYGTAATPGKYVYVRGSDGHTYAFMHLDEIAKLKRGQKLKVGDLIGTVGETGNAKGTTPHLHFEIRKGKPIDPYPRLTKEFTLEEKIEFLNEGLKDLKNNSKTISLMSERFSGVLTLAESKGYDLDTRLTKALAKSPAPSVASTSVGLALGSEGDGVRALQLALIRANVGPSAVRLGNAGATGYFGGMTRDALLEYQKFFGLPQNGTLTLATRETLMKGATGVVKGIANTVESTFTMLPSIVTSDIGVGARGVEVSLIQAFLITKNAGEKAQELQREGATGYFGLVTENAIREFQSVHGIQETGVYDEATRTSITSGYMQNV